MGTPAETDALQPREADLQVALRRAVSLWASGTTGESRRRQDLLRDKQRIVLSFFRDTWKRLCGKDYFEARKFFKRISLSRNTERRSD
jgi:hypothetical protein